MRRPERQQGPALARALFTEAPALTLATVTPDGQPVLRTLNGVVVEDAESPCGFSLAFHGAPDGEKLRCVGQPVVVGAERVVAAIPSWFTHPDRACPATTWYLSAQARGVLAPVEPLDERAALLQALMERFQPEGRYRPLRADDPMYAAAIRNLLVLRVRPEAVTAKASVGQDKPPEVRHAVLRRLWERGAPGDAAAIATALRFAPEPWPAWLCGPEGVRLELVEERGALGSGAARDAALEGAFSLLQHAEWTRFFSEEALRRGLQGGSAMVLARRGDAWVGIARAVTDGGKFGWIADVLVHEGEQGRGIGQALARLLLDHPAVRGCARLLLRTRIAEGFWEKQGFTAFARGGGRVWMQRGEATPPPPAPALPPPPPAPADRG